MFRFSALAVALGFASLSLAQDPIADRFKQLDKDGDGKLTVAELAMPALFKLLDKNGDGFVTMEEAAALRGGGGFGKFKVGKPPAGSPADDSPKEAPKPRPAAEAGVGRRAPDLAGTDLTGKAFQLSEFAKGKKAVVIAVTSGSCPISKKYVPTLAKLEAEYGTKGVAFAFVNPIPTDKPTAPEGFAGPYLADKDGALARLLGAESTGDVFVLDAKRTVVYRGAVDDQYGLGYSQDAPKKQYLKAALDSVLAGTAVRTPATVAPGCALDLAPAAPLDAANVTYHNRISRIFAAHCVECHRDGGVGPFALTSHADALAHKGMIRKVVEKGTMPPWFADKGEKAPHPAFVNDRSLTADDKAALLAWLKAGTPIGDPADAPLPRTFPKEWAIGKPDVVFQIPKPIAIKATGTMPYQTAVIDTKLTEDKWIRGYEIQPTDRSVVHHVLVFVVSGEAAGGEANNPLARLRDEAEERQGFFAAYVPGNDKQVFPDGFAKPLPKGAKLRFQIHYTPSGKATTDQVKIAFLYAKEPPRHELRVAGLANPRIKIPPEAANHPELASVTVPADVTVTSFMPHLHLRGKACRYEATLPDGKTITLLDIPRYDFNWQLRYELAAPVDLPKGTQLKFRAWFDNSDGNPANPDPKRTVRWGPQTTDEMHLGYVEFFAR